MDACLRGENPVPQWYLVLESGRIVAGAGVIENDFHDRKDLTPNVCAVYTEPDRRGRGLAGRLLGAICADMSDHGIDTLYLLTDHTSFYERYSWEFFCMAQGDGETEPSRMYVHHQSDDSGRRHTLAYGCRQMAGGTDGGTHEGWNAAWLSTLRKNTGNFICRRADRRS